jgi:hypothetical protein
LLHKARDERDAPGLARLMRWLGIADGRREHRLLRRVRTAGAVISAWPAVTFIGSVELSHSDHPTHPGTGIGARAR